MAMPTFFARRKQRVQFLTVNATSDGGFPVTVDVSKNTSLLTVTFGTLAGAAAGDFVVKVFPFDFNDQILPGGLLPVVRSRFGVIANQAVEVCQFDVTALRAVAGDVHNNNAAQATIISDWFLS